MSDAKRYVSYWITIPPDYMLKGVVPRPDQEEEEEEGEKEEGERRKGLVSAVHAAMCLIVWNSTASAYYWYASLRLWCRY